MSVHEVHKDMARLRDELHAAKLTTLAPAELMEPAGRRRVREALRIAASLCANRSFKSCAAELHDASSDSAQELRQEHAEIRRMQGDLEWHLARLENTDGSGNERRLVAHATAQLALKIEEHMTHILVRLPHEGPSTTPAAHRTPPSPR